MPGYETYRFVDLSEVDKTELTCSICQDIFRCPIFTNCCLQTFCEDCIHDWLEINNTCPYDRKPLNKSALTRPPRVFMNMLGKLKIRCDFNERGCNEVLLLENLTPHSLLCHYNLENLKKCEKCLCDWFIISDHDCIKSLLELNKKANEEINALKERKDSTTTERDSQNMSSRIEDSLTREIRELKSERVKLLKKLDYSDLEKNNFLRTIQELTNTLNFNTTAITTAQKIDLNRRDVNSREYQRAPQFDDSDIDENHIDGRHIQHRVSPSISFHVPQATRVVRGNTPPIDSLERDLPIVQVNELDQSGWVAELQTRNAKIVRVLFPRTANKDKELTVIRGEILEILDDSRKWWKARNWRGQVAYVPQTIITEINYTTNERERNQHIGSKIIRFSTKFFK